MRTVNVGVIGVGAMGENHVRVYHKREEANLMGVSDVSERALKKIEKKYGAKGSQRAEPRKRGKLPPGQENAAVSAFSPASCGTEHHFPCARERCGAYVLC